MKSLKEILQSYGDYHQNPYNKITHVIGVPIIVLSIMIATNWIYLLWPLIIITCAYYLYLSRPLGIILLATFILLGLLAQIIAPEANFSGVIIFFILFIGGWAIQFIGHGIEGKKPAFLDNIVQMLSAPLFVAHEIVEFFKQKKV